jgi:XTP/dITP diphosphohydrolase
VLSYVTTNPGKVREAVSYLGAEAVRQLEYDYVEIQSSDLTTVAAEGARAAHAYADEPVLVDDAGLFVHGLDGFPGPYSSYVEATLGVDRVQRVVAAESDLDDAAHFACVLAYCDGEPVDRTSLPTDDAPAGSAPTTVTVDEGEAGDPPVVCFEGRVDGRIVPARGDGGFGYDPIFEHDGRTFAEVPPEDKNRVSHRGRALQAFADWYDA